MLRQKEFFQRPLKKYKKVVYKEETESEPEIEIQYIPGDDPIKQEKEKEQKQFPSKRKNKIFEYLNKDAKKHKQ